MTVVDYFAVGRSVGTFVGDLAVWRACRFLVLSMSVSIFTTSHFVSWVPHTCRIGPSKCISCMFRVHVFTHIVYFLFIFRSNALR